MFCIRRFQNFVLTAFLALPLSGAMMMQGSNAKTSPTKNAWQETLSNDGSWRVQWRVLVDGKESELPIVRRRFTIELIIESTRNPTELPKSVMVDAQMPDHGHGMNVAPTMVLEKSRECRAEGMLFHMSGRWEVDVDIDDGITVERAQWNIPMY